MKAFWAPRLEFSFLFGLVSRSLVQWMSESKFQRSHVRIQGFRNESMAKTNCHGNHLFRYRGRLLSFFEGFQSSLPDTRVLPYLVSFSADHYRPNRNSRNNESGVLRCRAQPDRSGICCQTLWQYSIPTDGTSCANIMMFRFGEPWEQP